jgi:hypothetical protein
MAERMGWSRIINDAWHYFDAGELLCRRHPGYEPDDVLADVPPGAETCSTCRRLVDAEGGQPKHRHNSLDVSVLDGGPDRFLCRCGSTSIGKPFGRV